MSLLRLPGLIDIHVHLRDPGQTYKEDFYTGTTAALAGGITTVFDMPNNSKPIYSESALVKKENIATRKAVCDWGLFFGSDGKNIGEFEKVKDHVVGLKLYLTLTTGKYLIEEANLVKVFRAWPKDKVIMIHAQGEKVDRAINLTAQKGNRLHVTHVSTKADLELVLSAKSKGLPVTCDVTPHHLFLTRENTSGVEGFFAVKPPLRPKKNQQFLWDHLKDIDCIASDHAPHTKEEKLSNEPPFGMPGLETMLPLLITTMKEGRLSQEDIIRLTNTNPQKIFGIKQSDDTYVEVDTQDRYTIENERLYTKCGWSPFAGWRVTGRVKRVFIRGIKVLEDGKVLVSPGSGTKVPS